MERNGRERGESLRDKDGDLSISKKRGALTTNVIAIRNLFVIRDRRGEEAEDNGPPSGCCPAGLASSPR
jgi:hypothetical protein